MSLGRRLMVLGGPALGLPGLVLAAPAQAGSAPPPGDALRFAVSRRGSRIGSHALTFERHGAALSVHTEVDIVVHVGPIPVYRYTHRSTETTEAGRLTLLEGQTDANGTLMRVSARREPAGLVVEGTHGPRYLAPDGALTTSHWNRIALGGPMIGIQDGELHRPTVADLGHEAIPLSPSGTVTARHFRLSGDLTMELWYEDSDAWAGMAITVDDGSVILYVREG